MPGDTDHDSHVRGGPDSPPSQSSFTGADAAAAGMMMLATNALCAAVGAVIGALLGALLPLLLAGLAVGFGAGMYVVIRRFRSS